MDSFTEKDVEEALSAITSMISRTEKAKEKFAQGTSQHREYALLLKDSNSQSRPSLDERVRSALSIISPIWSSQSLHKDDERFLWI